MSTSLVGSPIPLHLVLPGGPDQPCNLTPWSCVALGLRDGTCPVGYVREVDRHGVLLVLIDFGDAWAWGRTRQVRWRAVVAVRQAQRITEQQARQTGWVDFGPAPDDETGAYWDVVPLREFQATWQREPDCLGCPPLSPCVAQRPTEGALL